MDDTNKNSTKEAIRYRVGAAFLDYLVVFTFIVSFVFLFGERVKGNTYRVQGPLALIPIVFWFIYFVVVESVFKCSLGKRLMNLEIASLDGGPVKFSQIVRRRVCDMVDFGFCFGLLGYVLMKNTINNQRLGDIWAETIVVKVDK